MKGKGHIQSFNDHQENLNISDVMQFLDMTENVTQEKEHCKE